MSSKTSTARLELALLGGFEARAVPSGRRLPLPLKKARAILACLALAPGGARPRQTLTGLLWAEAGEAEARNNFRVTLSSLRMALAAARILCLRIEDDTVVLDLDLVAADAVSFRRLVADGSPGALTEAIRVYRGDLLDGLDIDEVPFEEWLTGEREQLRILALGACEKMLAYQLRAGADEAALASAVRLLALDPLRESVHATVMRLHAKHGRFGPALQQYNACAQALQRDLGVAPAPATRELHEEILHLRAADHRGRAHSSARARGPAVQWPPMIRVPHVGRIEEMRKLREALQRALDRRGQVVAVMGEAGIGKTRLVNELAGEAERAEARVWLGRAYESDRILTFGPWVDAIRTSGLARDGAFLGDLSPRCRSELGRLVPELGEPSPKAARHQDNPRQIFEAVVQLVNHAIERQPLVLILEDMHWADELSARLVSFLARRITEWPVLVVATARDEEVDARSALRRTLNELRTVGVLVPVDLTPLSQTDTAALVHELVHAEGKSFKPAPAIPRIWAASRGNPFMIVEAVQALGDDASAAVAESLPLTPVVREVVAGRLGRLSEHGRRLISIAAVIGRVFEFPVLQRASELRELEAAEAVDDLIRRRLLNVVQHGLEVTHDWVREVAYSELQPPRRQILHAAVARAVENQYAENLEPHYPALGRHYLEGEVWDKAVVYLLAAGRASAARVGYREAVSRFEGALAALRHLPESRETTELTIDIHIDLRNALVPLGEWVRLGEHLHEAERLARTLSDQHRLGRIAAFMTTQCLIMGDYEEAIRFGRQALRIAPTVGDRSIEVVATSLLGVAHAARGEFTDAVTFFKRNVALEGELRYERFGATVIHSAASAAWLAESLSLLGRFDEAIGHAEAAVQIAETADHPYTLYLGLLWLGLAHLRRGDLPRATRVLERCHDLSRTWPTVIAIVGTTLSAAYALAGRADEALPLLAGAVEEFRRCPVHFHPGLILLCAGMTSFSAGRIDEAAGYAREALALTRRLGARASEAHALCLAGDIASAAGADNAERYYREALALATELAMRPLVAHCHLGLGTLYRRKGRREQAQEHLTTATTLYRDMGMTYWLEKAEAEMKD